MTKWEEHPPRFALFWTEILILLFLRCLFLLSLSLDLDRLLEDLFAEQNFENFLW